MRKLTFISILLVSTALFVSCSPIIRNNISSEPSAQKKADNSNETNIYGAYLAGRIAHIRKDFDNAADYYKIAYAENPENKALIDRLYLLLASKGHIDEAAGFAQKAVDNKTSNGFARMLIAAKATKDGQYEQSISMLDSVNDPIYKSLITPLVNTWNYAGLNKQKEAFAQLDKLKKEEGLSQIYTIQRAMLFDYFGKNREAGEAYDAMLNNKNVEISVRTLELMSNFYIRTGQKEKAVALLNAAINNQNLESMLKALHDKVMNADTENTAPVLSTPQVGAAEALFAVGSTFRYDEAIDVAHMYTALSTYLNPDYSTAKILMADIFETREMFDDANQIYDNINKTDIAYYPAQLKKARNLIKQEDYKGAEILLESLSEDYDDAKIYMELGDILRLNNRLTEAVEYYDKALAKTQNPVSLWVLYYAKGVSLERLGEWKKAEETLMKAYKLKRHYLVLNHLGYTWIRQDQNIDQAFEMIVDAYNQAPFDPSINDSLGFALYNLGYYTMALPYLERAVELYPSSAVISSHLGDAYWFAHRKNEAKFQWQHALSLKDESGELDIEATKDKIKKGIKSEPNLSYDKEKIEKAIGRIRKAKVIRRI